MQSKVYALWHTYETKSGVEDIKFLGAYSTEARAKEALEQVRSQPGFCDYPDGFEIAAVTLDTTDWRGGFANAWDDDKDEKQGK
jgi:homoserine kinase type II